MLFGILEKTLLGVKLIYDADNENHLCQYFDVITELVTILVT